MTMIRTERLKGLRYKEIKGSYPRVSQLFFRRLNGYENGSMYIHQDCFGNCQMFGIVEARVMLLIPKDDLTEVLKSLLSGTSKRQCTIDVLQSDVENIRKKLKNHTVSFRTFKYISTNQSLMALCRIEFLKYDKLKEIP
tara:strand:+ start:41622 stop:42038 length:417 start_codon:yes stop_codon:yes gene_type:complete